METSVQQLSCPFCHAPIYPTDKFCPSCGKSLKEVTTISFSKQIYIYAVSLLLPPLGLVWTFKYVRSENTKLRTIGLVAGAVTIVSFVLSLWWFLGFWNGLQQQISTYSNLGY